MRLLVLGGTRFIGDRIVRAAQRRGDEVTIVHRGLTEPADDPAGDAPGGHGTHVHVDRADFAAISARVRALRPDAVIDTCALTRADADSVLPHLPDVPVILLSSTDVYRAYELLLADEGGQPVPITEDADVRRGRYPLRGRIEGHDDYDKLDVEPAYLARGGTVLRLGAIYGERDPQRREEFILRRVRAGRKRIPVGAGTWLWTRGYVADVASRRPGVQRWRAGHGHDARVRPAHRAAGRVRRRTGDGSRRGRARGPGGDAEHRAALSL
jgi:hypothetical protein